MDRNGFYNTINPACLILRGIQQSFQKNNACKFLYSEYIFCDLQTELIVLFIKLDVEWIACHGIVGSLPNYKILLYVGQRSVGICLYCTKYVRFPE